MRSIWNNSFYSTPPALAWTYEVIFDEVVKPVFGYDFHPVSKCLTEAVVNINIPDRETETESVYYGGLEFPIYTRHKNAGTFTIKFNENMLYDASKALDILYTAYAFDKDYLYCKGNGTDKDSIIGYKSGVYDGYAPATITVNIFNPELVTYVQGSNGPLDEKVITRRIRFEDCKILSIGGFTLDYESTDTITREVTFSYAKMIDGYVPEEVEETDNKKSDGNGSPDSEAKGDGSNEQKVADEPSPAAAAANAAGAAEAAAKKSRESADSAAHSAADASASAQQGQDAADSAARSAEEAAAAETRRAKEEAAAAAEAGAVKAKAAEMAAAGAAAAANTASSDASRAKASADAANKRATAEAAKAQADEKAKEEAEKAQAAAYEAAANAAAAANSARVAGEAQARAAAAAAAAQASAGAAKRS